MKDLSHLPLTKNQRRLWISYLQDQSNPAYNLKLTYHLKGGLDIEIFEKSLTILFDQHHTVYSVFRQEEGIPYIEIVPQKIIIQRLDYSSESPESAIREIYSFVASDSRKPLNIETGPLFRLYLLKAGTG